MIFVRSGIHLSESFFIIVFGPSCESVVLRQQFYLTEPCTLWNATPAG
jgi:hypothetical protein